MKRFWIVLLLSAICFARVGETKAQLLKRYGTPVFSDKDDEIYIFKHVDYSIDVTCFSDKCCVIGYNKKSDFLDIEINALLNKNIGEFIIISDKLYSKTYKSKTNDNLAAMYDSIERKLIIFDLLVYDKYKVRLEQRKTKELEGF